LSISSPAEIGARICTIMSTLWHSAGAGKQL
jgi:hypothetical protein